MGVSDEAMSRTHKDRVTSFTWWKDAYIVRWPKSGKFWKRQHNKALRSWYRETGGKERSVIRRGRECEWKTW